MAPTQVAEVAGYRVTQFDGDVRLAAPTVPGSHDLIVIVEAGGRGVAENRYPIHVVEEAPDDVAPAPPFVVGEGALDASTGAQLRQRLYDGETAIVLAQEPDAAPHYPVPVEVTPVATEWGSSVFHFTTDDGALPSLPRRTVLVAEDSTIQARSVITKFDGDDWPSRPVVIAYKPAPRQLAGAVVGAHAVGGGRLIFCQYRLEQRLAAGDAAARALFADLTRWAASPRPPLVRETRTKPDGRALTFYSYEPRTLR